MKRKRFAKICMGSFGFDRNAANAFAETIAAGQSNENRVAMAECFAHDCFPFLDEIPDGFTAKNGDFMMKFRDFTLKFSISP